ncbi:2-octaprenyl-6-methoxyphenyl hydroxylase [Candidatus Erwinia haradaeae]|uniref:2-octaprenyl-6-methoxyphenol hydroxylase n=1 Tax=Candidatus Erwinia haradaeae TaxID=1922217 RepID=A0A451D8V3_9GAMM|nr:2-octaprenyl-6-methoxyphenyl hydroxylase [Candidatus Erwinia haradaeae]VFP82270.1 2-octaprenyl-6-methoxyphenol hydroxylase [Candidatus Erwinia haradaeae]
MSVIIVGAGLAGLTLAFALSYLTQGKKDIKLVEATSPDKFLHPNYNGRTIALAYGLCRKIDALNLWSLLDPIATAITRIHVSELGSGGFFSLDASTYGIPFLGQVFELNQAKKNFFSHLEKTKNITLYCPNTVVLIKQCTDYILIKLDNGEKIKGDLLVAADGTFSNIARLCGLQWEKKDYQQIALVTKISTELAHQGQAFERFTRHESLALLPISSGFSSLVLCLDRTKRKTMSNWNDKEFLSYLQKIFGWRLGKITKVDKRYFYPIESCTRVNTITQRIVLVSNAAQTLHPIAGQGLNLGMRDILTLTDILISAWKTGKKAGDYSTLKQYQKQRIIDVKTTIHFTDLLVRLFSHPSSTLFIGRTLGLMMINDMACLRNILIKRSIQ